MPNAKKSLAETHPEVAKQWHPTKNGDLTPFNVAPYSHKKVWWICDKGIDHEWIASVASRSNGRGCGVCRGFKVVNSNCLATTDPELAKEWHPTLNESLTPFNVTAYSSKKVWWKCPKGDDHVWSSSVAHRKNGSGCGVCRGFKVVNSNCLATTDPELAKEWHPTLNESLTPFNVTAYSSKKVWWKCPKGDDHVWSSSVAHRKNGSGCGVCRGFKVVNSNCLATTDPELAKEWHPTLNESLTPFDVTAYSSKKRWWKCDKGIDHEWKAETRARTDKRGKSSCPFCTLTPQSKQELTITFELMKLFKNIDPKGLKAKLEGRLRSIDIYIDKLSLCIEFDGSYWHKGKRELDKIKSEMLFKEGFKLIRVREEPLKKIYDTDVISKQPYNGKQVTNDILSVVLEMYELDDTIVSKINEYQSKDKLQNEKGLERYIDKILTEKAERKSSKTKTAK